MRTCDINNRNIAIFKDYDNLDFTVDELAIKYNLTKRTIFSILKLFKGKMHDDESDKMIKLLQKRINSDNLSIRQEMSKLKI